MVVKSELNKVAWLGFQTAAKMAGTTDVMKVAQTVYHMAARKDEKKVSKACSTAATMAGDSDDS